MTKAKQRNSTESVCPECFRGGEIKVIPADIVEEDGKVYMVKKCEEHGEFKEICWEDVDMYNRSMESFTTGLGVANPHIEGANCPHDCGLCRKHKSQSVLTNLYVTNRCDLRCSYCFANAGVQDFVYEPSLEELVAQMMLVRNEKPVPGKALQITGGEPMIRDDIIGIIKLAKELGFTHIQLNTNGIRLGDDPELAKEVRESGTNTIYMSFDGVTEETNPWLNQNLRAIENCRNADMGVVLVPAVIGGMNDHELGDIVNFAKENIDVVRGVNFQPVSFVGKAGNLSEEGRKRKRITYSGTVKKLEKQLDGAVKAEDWYPVPFVLPVSKLVEKMTGDRQVEFTCHPSCGGATYVFVEDGEMIPITRFLDVEGLRDLIQENTKKSWPLRKMRIGISFLWNLPDFVKWEKVPEGLNMVSLLKSAILGGSYDGLGKFHEKSLFLGSMWFQDVWNLDLSRLKRCVIHYATPEGVIPFCAYNGLGYRDRILKRHSISVSEWEERTGRKLKDDLWDGGPIS